MTFLLKNSILAASLISTLPLIAQADDAALYAEPAPEDAAFVRFIGFAPGSQVAVDGLTFDVPTGEANAYVAVSAARLPSIESGAYLTVLQGADGTVQQIDEPARDSRTKVHLLLINAGSAPVSLGTADGSVAVVESVAQGSANSRAVNPVAVSLAVFGPEQAQLGTFDVALRRGQNLSFIVDGTQAQMIENSFGPVLK